MKKILFLLLTLVSLCCQEGQAQHFKFMGIPIDGSIENFETKLKEKGFVNSVEYSKFNSTTRKHYDGVFAGKDVFLTVKITPKSKLVYCVSANHLKLTEKWAQEEKERMKEAIAKKYNAEKQNVLPTMSKFGVENGNIMVSYQKVEELNKYIVSIIYFDIKNTYLCNKERKEDL